METLGYASVGALNPRRVKIALPGDILISVRAPVGPTNVADIECCIGRGLAALRATDSVDRDFLLAALRLNEPALVNKSSGSTFAAITTDHLRALRLALPPLMEQKNLASALAEHLSAADEAGAAVKAQADACYQLIEAYLRESLSSHSIQTITLKKCLTEVTRGVGHRWTEYPLLGVSRAGLASPKAPIGKSPERYKLVDHGTIFYNPMRILLGSIALVDADDAPGIASPDYVICKANEGVLHYRWFYYWLRSSYGEAFIKTLARGAVRERMLFKRLAAAEISLPPWKVQVETAERLKAVAEARRAFLARLSAINELPPLLLQKAFSGQLSPRPSFQTQAASTTKTVSNARLDVSSYIVAKLYEQTSFGHVMHQKIIYLTETKVGIELGGVYYRDAAGPHEGLEFYRLNGLNRQAAKQGAFNVHKRSTGRGYFYTLGSNIAEHLVAAEQVLGDRKPELDRILDLFTTMNTDEAEIVATLFAAWNDFLLAGHTPTDAEIITEVRENWHPKKKRFSPETLQQVLDQMRQQRLVPQGLGPATRRKNAV